MSNEELAVLIRAGERERLPQLWAQVEKFVAAQARTRLVLSAYLGGVEFEDFYDSGYIALVAAVETFDPEAGGSFIGWLALHLKTAFSEAGWYRSPKQAQDPLHRAGSLDVPAGDDEDGAALVELIVDPVSALGFERVEECQYRAQLRAQLGAALGRLPAHCRDIIRRRFYRGQTFSAIAAEMGIPQELVRKWEGEALKQLRHPRISRSLRQYLPGGDHHG